MTTLEMVREIRRLKSETAAMVVLEHALKKFLTTQKEPDVPCNDGAIKPHIPEELYDGYAVYTGLDDRAKEHTTPKNVSDVLDSAVRLIRKRIGEA